MSNEIFYPTASTSVVFINGIHVDQAFRVDYKESVSRTPIYGYNDTYYSKVAIGKSLIQGMLIVNFTLPFYLNYVFTNVPADFVPKLYNMDETLTPSQQEKYKLLIKNKIATELPANDEENKQARIEYLAKLVKTKDSKINESTRKAIYDAVNDEDKLIYRKTLGSYEAGKSFPEFIPSPLSDNPLSRDGVILDVYYTEPDNSAWFTRFYGVHFFEVSQQINQAGAEGSSEPLYEIYSFIAQKKETRFTK